MTGRPGASRSGPWREPAGGLPAAAEIVTGDLADQGSLVAAMHGIEKVLLSSSPHTLDKLLAGLAAADATA